MINYKTDQNEKKIVHFFKNLMIKTSKDKTFNVNIISSNDEINEIFNISINTVDAIESFLIIKDLVNVILIHRIIVINKISLIAFVLYDFNFTIEIRYDF